MDKKKFYESQELMKRINDLKAFTESCPYGLNLSHVVVINHDNTKNAAVPAEFTYEVTQHAIGLAKQEIERLEGIFNAL